MKLVEPGQQQQRQIAIDGFFGTAVVRCICGAPNGIIVPVLAEGDAASQCQMCGTVFRVVKIDLDQAREPGKRFTMSVTAQPPVIARPIAVPIVTGN